MAFDLDGLPAPPDLRNWGFAEGLVKEPEAARAGRLRAPEIGANFVSPATGAALSFLASTLGAKQIVEIGTGVGTAIPWLLRGMAADGQITTLDADGEHHRVAKELVAGLPGHVRFITGKPLDVLPRLADRSYDLAVLSLPSADLSAAADEALRLLKVGGVLAMTDALGDGKVGDPAQRDPATVSRRLLVQRLADDIRLHLSLLPVGDGLLVAKLHTVA